MQPMLMDGVALGTFQYEGSDEIHYYAETAEGDEHEITPSLWNALYLADGIHPLNLPDQGKDVVPLLKDMGLIRTSRFVRETRWKFHLTLFPISPIIKKPQIWQTAFLIIIILTILFLSVGFILWLSDSILIGPVFDDSVFSLILFPTFLYLSILLHELGHLIAGSAFGLRSIEIGFSYFLFFCTGAYIRQEDTSSASKAVRVLVASGGIIIHLLIAGICLLLARWYFPLSFTLTLIADFNIFLAILNLLPSSGSDGETIWSAVIGMNSLEKAAKRCLFSKIGRRSLLRLGLPGYACYLIFAFTLFSNVLIWLISIAFGIILYQRV